MSYQNVGSGRFERDCAERWRLIKPELPQQGVILDVGSAEGYFLKAIADETNLLAIGVEKNKWRVHAQLRWLDNDYNGRIVSCCSGITTEFVQTLSETPEWIDGVLLLSVLHWINNDDFLKAIAKTSGKLFVEIPQIDDTRATGQKFVQRVREYGSEKLYLEKVSGRTARHLGAVRAHTSSTRNLWVLEGNVQVCRKRPHINYEGKQVSRRYDHLYIDGEVAFYRNFARDNWIPGINLATLKALGIAYPSQKWWNDEIQRSVDVLDMGGVCGDMRIHNVIVSRNKVQWIDLNHHTYKTTVFEDIKGMVCEAENF